MIARITSDRRKVAVALIMVILVIVAVILFMQWQTANDEKANVEREKATEELRLTTSRVDYDIDGLERQKAELSRTAKFPENFPATGLAIFLADAAYWDRVNIQIPQWTKSENTQIGTQYTTRTLITGSLSNIISFLTYIERGDYSSLKVQAVDFQGAEASGQATFDVILITQS